MSYDDWKTETPEDQAAAEAAALRKLLGRDEPDPDRMREDRDNR